MTTTLIAGATRGVGFELARRLVQVGHTVHLGARDPARGRAAAGAVEVLVAMAAIGADGPTGTFVGNDGPLPW